MVSEKTQICFHTLVPRAVRSLWITSVLTANSAPRLATMKGVSVMDNNYFQALMGYKASMAQAKILLSKGLITTEEYSVIETKMCGIFGINSDSLFRENDWIYTDNRGNIAPVKEVL